MRFCDGYRILLIARRHICLFIQSLSLILTLRKLHPRSQSCAPSILRTIVLLETSFSIHDHYPPWRSIRKCEYINDGPCPASSQLGVHYLHTVSPRTNLIIILGMMQVSKKIPFDDPQVLLGVRILYIVTNIIIAGVYLYLQNKINAKKGTLALHSSMAL